MMELTVDATIENITSVTAFVEEQLEVMDCPMKTVMQINIVIDELFSNIANYAYPSGAGPATVRIEALEEPKAVKITFIDKGIPYNPLLNEEPDVTLSAEERKVGGLGIFLVKKSVDDISYEYQNGQNILQIVKRL